MKGKSSFPIAAFPVPTTVNLARVLAEMRGLKSQKTHVRRVGTFTKNFFVYFGYEFWMRLWLVLFEDLKRGLGEEGTYEEFGVVVLEDVGCFCCCCFLVCVSDHACAFVV